MRKSLVIAAGALLALPAATSASVQTPEAFYKGNRITVVIGCTPGGVYDIYARTIVRHLGKQQQKLEIDPVPGDEIQALVRQIYASPSDVVARARAAIKDGMGRTVSR